MVLKVTFLASIVNVVLAFFLLSVYAVTPATEQFLFTGRFLCLHGCFLSLWPLFYVRCNRRPSFKDTRIKTRKTNKVLNIRVCNATKNKKN